MLYDFYGNFPKEVPPLKPIDPESGSHMTIEEWYECVEAGGFIDYDGHGSIATIDGVSNFNIQPSMVKVKGKMKYNVVPSWATHIMWYNR